MTDPHKKARDADRNAAIKVVEAAYVGRQITKPDYELRADRLRRAGTVGEIHMLVQDLRHEADVRVTPAVERVRPGKRRPVFPGGAPQVDTKKLAVVVVGVVVAVGAALPLGILSGVQQDGGVESGTFEFGDEVELTSARGYRALAAAVEEKTGSRTIFTATIYPGYAIVDVPLGQKSKRSVSYRYDGSWQERSGSGGARAERIDLDRIEGSTVVTLLRKVARLVDEPTSTYLQVNARGGEKGVCLTAYATNQASETAYLDARCNGEVVARYVS